MSVSDFDFDPNFEPKLRVLSFGGGVQSSTLAAMCAVGEFNQMPDCGIMADTMHEPQAVYDWVDWLAPQLPFQIHRVSHGDLWKSATRVRTSGKTGNRYIATGIPIYTQEGLRRGIGQRHCTRDFKINPINRKVRELLGKIPKRSGPLVEMWIGISTDEAVRMKPSIKPWIRHRWPLIERGMSRSDCLAWMKARGFSEPPRSACTFCPFRDDNSWLDLAPSEFSDAIQKERQLQDAYAQTIWQGVPYLHADRVPLDQVRLVRTKIAEQLSLRLGKFADECNGMCGV